MDIDRVLADARAADSDLGPVELAESIWLAAHLTGGIAADREVGAPPDVSPTGEQRSDPLPEVAARRPASGAASRSRAPLSQTAGPDAARLYLSTGGTDHAGGLATRSPAVPALRNTLQLSRSLRPLRRRLPSRGAPIFDEERTAQTSAESRRWIACHRPEGDRWLRLELVTDASPSMVVWRRTITELRMLFERLGAFRDVRSWSIDTGSDGTSAPLLRSGSTFGAGHRTVRDARELHGPDEGRVVLVVSDCVGPAWHSGALLGWLKQWGRSGPTAIVQPLPQRLWGRSALDVARVRLRAGAPATPNHRLGITVRDPDLQVRGVVVPILEAEPRWLGPWAKLVAGTAPGGIWSAATCTGWSPHGRLFGPRTVDPQLAEDPVQTVRRFRAGASPEAYELARYLAAAPLSLPVMRLVQSVTLPRSRPRHLAELFLSDLLRRASPTAAHQDSEDVVYDFRDGIREVLAGTLGPDTGLQILAKVSDFIGARMGAALDFPALLAGTDVPESVDQASQPFAAVAQTVLRTLGGRYTGLADRLATAMQRPTPPRSAPPTVGTRLPFAGRPTHTPTAIPGGTVNAPTPPLGAAAQQPPPSQPAVWGGVPPRNPNFTGREELLLDLREQLTSKVTALLPHTLHGLGGVGKTQLAVEYVYRFTGSYDLVWWVPSEQAPMVRQSLMSLAPRLNLTTSIGDDVSQTLTAINDALRLGRPHRRWLLVFDNADRPEDLAPFLSNPGGHILITSRSRSWSGVAETVEVDVFERAESIELLRRRLPAISEAAADTLADRLGDLPLALEQAGAWQSATAMPASEYLRLLDEQTGALLSESAPSSYPEPVAVAWGLAFVQLTERAPAALQMLELCSFLGSEPISVRLLREGRRVDLPEPLNAAVRDDIPMRRAIRDIDRYGLAKVDSSKDSLQIHRLVQAVLRDRMSEDQRARYRASVHALLEAADPGDPGDEQGWPRHAELSPHVVSAGLVDADDADVRRVVLNQIRYRWMLGDFEGSRELGELALGRWRERLGENDVQALVAGRYVAVALRSLGRVAAARELNSEVYGLTRSTFTDDHEHTLATANSVGADLRLRGEWRKARDLDADLLVRHRRVFGPDDANTFRSANNLAVDHRLLGDFTAALAVDTDTAERLHRKLGAEHPDTLRMISNLSRDHYGLGEYRRALELQRQSLPVHRALLGPDHAEVLRATRIHVATLRKTGATIEACELAEDLAGVSRRRFGDNHPDTIAANMTLSNCLASVERMTEARVIGEDTLARYRELLSEEHPFTLATMTNLATVLRAMGDYAEARAMDERSHTGFRTVLGKDHLYAHCAAMNLANDLAVAHDHTGAVALSERALAGLIAVLGSMHPQALACAHNLAVDVAAAGDATRARSMAQATLAQLRETFGTGHPDTLVAESGRRISIELEPPNP